MKGLSLALKVFGYVWCVLVFFLILGCYLIIWIKYGFSKVQETLSPFNVGNLAVTIVALAPGMTALHFSKTLASKIKDRSDNN